MEEKMKKFFLYGFLILAVLASTASTALAAKDHRNFILIFQVTEYNAKIADGVDYFFNKILKPADMLSIFSPTKPYSFPPKTRQAHPVNKLIQRTKDVLKRDITVGTSNYQQTLQNMTQMVLDISNSWGPSGGGGLGGSANISDLKRQLILYRQMLADLRNMRKLNENLFLKLAAMFKKLKGENSLNIFYQKELRITPDRDTMEALRGMRDIRFDAIEAFDEDSSEEFMDVEKVSRVLKDAGVTLNFFYIQKQSIRRTGMQSKEFSGDVYSVFSKIAEATGGVVIATSKPSAALKKTFGGK